MRMGPSKTPGGLGFEVLFGIGCLLLCSTGCSSFLWHHGMKQFRPEIRTAGPPAALNEYQEDFVYLKTLCDEVFPVADRYFPSERRAAMEHAILQNLVDSNCTRETFVLGIRTYLAAFNNQHARLDYNPKPVQ